MSNVFRVVDGRAVPVVSTEAPDWSDEKQAWDGFRKIDGDELEWSVFEHEHLARWMVVYGFSGIESIILFDDPLDVIRVRSQLDMSRIAFLLDDRDGSGIAGRLALIEDAMSHERAIVRDRRAREDAAYRAKKAKEQP